MNPVLPLPEIGAELVVDPAADLPDEAFLRDELPAVLTVRSRRPGDRLVPFGSHRPKKLQDLFTDARIPREQRDGYPVLLAGDTIIWVPGLRRAEFGRISRDQASVRLALRSVPNS
jgi:tRNA(Ile)-lysidine synthase